MFFTFSQRLGFIVTLVLALASAPASLIAQFTITTAVEVPTTTAYATGTVTMAGGTLTFSSAETSNAFTFGGLEVQSGTGNISLQNTASAAINLSLGATASTLYEGVLSGPGSLTKIGTSTLTLSGTNTYTGGTAINLGVLNLASAGALGTSGTISFGGGTLQYSSSNFPDYSSRFSQAAGQEWRIDVNGKSVTFATAFTSVGGKLIKSDSNPGGGVPATLILTANNTYSGGTTINSGRLKVGSGGNTGSLGTGGVINNSILEYDRLDLLEESNAISGTGELTQSGSGRLVLTGANTYAGVTTIISGSGGIQVGKGATSGSLGAGGVVNNANLSFARSDVVTYADVISGTGSVTQAGTGTLTLTGANTYSGGTTISFGTLQIGNNGTIGSIAGNVINNATLTFARSDDITFAQTVSGIGKLIQNANSTLTLTGANTYSGGTIVNTGWINIGATNALASSGTVYINANTVAGSAGLRLGSNLTQTIGALTYGGSDAVIGAYNAVDLYTGSTLTLGGTVTYLATNNPGPAYINSVGGGTLALGGNRIFDIGNSTGTNSELNIYVPITGAGFSLTKAGAGRLFLTAANTYTGGTIITGGELFTLASSNNVLPSGGDLTLNTITPGSYGDFIIGAGATQTIGALTFGGPNATSTSTNRVFLNGPGSTLTLGGDVTYIATNNPLMAGIYGTTGTLNLGGNRVFNIGDSSSASTAELVIASALAGTGFSLTKTGAGWLALTGSNTYTGGTTISAGTLELNNSTVLGDIVNNASLVVNNSVDGTYAGNISGTGAVIKGINTSILTLTGNNTFTGGLTLNGPVSVSSDSNLGAASGSLTFNNNSLITTANMALASTRSVVLASGSTYGGFSPNSGTTLTYGGVISGLGGLYKWNSGTLTLTGANTYTGDTTIGYGILQVGANGTTGSILGHIVENATLTFARSDNVTFASTISGTGGLIQAGAGTLTLTGANTYAGGTTISSGILQVGANGTIGSILGNIVDNATLTFARSDNVTFANIISGTGGFVQAGAGTLIFSNNNTYAGGTLISNGTLQLGNGAAAGMHGLGDVVNNSHLIFNRSDGGHYDQVISGTGDVTKAGAGTLIYTRDNTYSGGTIISDGAIQVGRNSYDPADPYELITNTGGTTGSIGAGPVLNNSHLIFNRSDNISYTGTVTGTGDFIKNGSGALTISSNANAFSGGVVINAGKLLVTNSAGSATGSGAVNVNNGAAFGGTGLISGALIINGGGSVSPGSSPGQLQVGNGTTFASGGHYVFEINNTAGAPGTNWDLLSISGGLTISATVSTPFVLDLVSLNAGNTNGLLANFDPTLAYSWKFVTTTTGITGFSAGAFQYNASNFSNSLDIGHFYVSQAGNDLYLNFTPVPEPTTWVLLSLGLSSVLLSLRRKSRARLVE